jgi:hypothetical protein
MVSKTRAALLIFDAGTAIADRASQSVRNIFVGSMRNEGATTKMTGTLRHMGNKSI